MPPIKSFPEQILHRLLRKFRPTETQLRTLSRQDRPGLHVELPKVEPSSLEKGRLAFQRGEYAESLHHYAQSTKEDSNNAWAWHGRGDALQLLGDYNGALEAYEQAIALQPHTALHFGGKSNALKGLCKDEEAMAARKQALELDDSVRWLFKD